MKNGGLVHTVLKKKHKKNKGVSLIADWVSSAGVGNLLMTQWYLEKKTTYGFFEHDPIAANSTRSSRKQK